MTAQPAQTKMVKLIAKTELILTERVNGVPTTRPIAAGDTFDVPENEVKGWTAPVKGPYAFRGERDDAESSRESIVRAEIYKKSTSPSA